MEAKQHKASISTSVEEYDESAYSATATQRWQLYESYTAQAARPGCVLLQR